MVEVTSHAETAIAPDCGGIMRNHGPKSHQPPQHVRLFVRSLLQTTFLACHEKTSSVIEPILSHRRRVLFLCTDNSCRSQMTAD